MSNVGKGRIAGKKRKMKEYNVFKYDMVTDKLSEGWEVYGSPMILEDTSARFVVQSMVKYEEPEVVKLPIGTTVEGGHR